jgi:hypothetical protein
MARGQYTPPRALEDLRALVRYAERDIPGSWLAVLNIAGRESDGGGRFMSDVIGRFKEQPPTDREAVRLELRAFLRALAGASSLVPPYSPTLHLLREGSRVRIAVSGSPRDVTLYLAAALAQEAGIDRLRCCRAPDCGKTFVKIGRREYCSSVCQRQVFLSNYSPDAARPIISRTRRKQKRDARATRKR